MFDSKLYQFGRGASVLLRSESSLIDFMAEFDFVHRFPLDHPRRKNWALKHNGHSNIYRSYLHMVLVRRVGVNLVCYPTFYCLELAEHQIELIGLPLIGFVWPSAGRMFSISVLYIWDFQGLIQRALFGTVTWNRWWVSPRHRMRDFTINYAVKRK